jgi:hypothetical protein
LTIGFSATQKPFRWHPFFYLPFFVPFEAFAPPPLDPAAGFEAAFLELPVAAFAPAPFLAPPELVLLAAFPLPPELLAALLLPPVFVPPDFAPADLALLDPADLDPADFGLLPDADGPADCVAFPLPLGVAFLALLVLDVVPALFVALDAAPPDFVEPAADFPPPVAEAPDFAPDEDFFPPVAVLTAAPAAPTTAPDAAPARISPATSFALSMMVSSTPLPPDPFLDLPPVDFGFDDPFCVVAMSSLLKLISKLLRDGGSKLCANISRYIY